MDELPALLDKLSKFKKRASPEVVTILQDIRETCMNAHDDRGILASFLFSEQNNILRFAQDTAGVLSDKSHQQAQVLLFDFIDEFIVPDSEWLKLYSLDIKEACRQVFRRDDSNKVKEATFGPLEKALKLEDMPSSWEDDLDIDGLIHEYKLAYEGSKSAQTVKGLCLELLGTIAEKFPHRVGGVAPKLFDIFERSLDQELKNKQRNKLITGALKGLSSLLKHFDNLLSGAQHAQTLYGFVRTCLEYDKLHNYDVPKAALGLLGQHARLLRSPIIDNYQDLMRTLVQKCREKNRELRDAAFQAIESFFTEIAEEIVEGSRPLGTKQELYKFFMQTVFGLLEGGSLAVAVRALGRFAEPIAEIGGQDELQKVFAKLVHLGDALYGSSDQASEVVAQLPNLLTAFANIFFHMTHITDSAIGYIERLSTAVFLAFPQLFNKQRPILYDALVDFFAGLFVHPAAFHQVVPSALFHGLVYTVSSLDRDPDPDRPPPYKDYEELWGAILNARTPPFSRLPSSSEPQLRRALYDVFLEKAVLAVLTRLDLRYTTLLDQSEETSEQPRDPLATNGEAGGDGEGLEEGGGQLGGDMFAHLRPRNPKDFALFLNLVNFCVDVLPKYQPSLLLRWAFVFGSKLVALSRRLPLVSGFYKLFQALLEVCDKECFFLCSGTSKDEVKEACCSLVSTFVSEVLLRLNQFKDELLASCIRMILSTPLPFVTFPKFFEPLKLALNIGISFAPMVALALDALERWVSDRRHELIPHLPALLPSLNQYLILRSHAADGADAQASGLESQPSARRRRRRKPAVETGKEKQQELIQKRIVGIIGLLGGECHMLATDESSALERSLKFDTTLKVNFTLTFQETKPSVHFDLLLPRVLELAERAADRQAKLNACEFLHATVHHMIGCNAKDPRISKEGDDAPTAFYRIYTRVFPVILRLAVDPEEIVQKLFRPLVPQMIHWFTASRRAGNKDTIVLLDSIVEAASAPGGENGALREFGASCLGEFFKYSRKHLTSADERSNPLHVGSLIRRIHSLARHPEPYRRLAAALCINNIYKDFRESEELVSTYLLEIMQNMLMSLQRADKDEPSLGTIDQSVLAVKNMERIILYKRDLLSRPATEGQRRAAFETLGCFVDWLAGELASPQPRYRHEVLRLFAAFGACLPGLSSSKDWVASKFGKDIQPFLTKLEAPEILNQRPGPNDQPALLISWTRQLTASLDAYTYLFNQGILDPPVALNRQRYASGQSALLPATRYFLSGVLPLPLDGPSIPKAVSDQHNLARSTCIESLLRHMYHLSESHRPVVADLVRALSAPGSEAESESGSERRLPEVSANAILHPTSLGFVRQLGEQETQAPVAAGSSTDHKPSDGPRRIAQKMVEAVCRALNPSESTEFLRPLCKGISTARASIVSLDPAADESIVLQSLDLLSGFEEILSSQMLTSLIADKTDLARVLTLSCFDKASDDIPPISRRLANEMLHLAFQLGVEPHLLLDLLTDRTAASNAKPPRRISRAFQAVKDTMGTESKGLRFYKTFRDVIIKQICDHFDQFRSSLFRSLDRHRTVSSVLLHVVEHIVREKVASKRKEFVNQVLQDIGSIERWWQSLGSRGAELESQTFVIDFFRNLLLIDAPSFVSPALSPAASRFLIDLFIWSTKAPTAEEREAVLSQANARALQLHGLELLPFLLSVPGPHIQTITGHIADLIQEEFPVRSAELARGSKRFTDYISILDRLLKALEKSCSVPLMETLMVLFRDPAHVHREAILRSFTNFVANTKEDPDSKNASRAFETAFSLFLDDRLPLLMRRASIDQVCAPFLSRTDLPVQWAAQTLSSRLKEIMRLIQDGAPAAGTTLSYLINYDDERTALTLRTCAFNILEVAFLRLPVSALKEIVNVQYAQKPGLSFVNEVIKLAQAYMKAAPPGTMPSECVDYVANKVGTPAVIECRTSAYRTLSAALQNAYATKAEIFICTFQWNINDSSKGIWAENLVDTSTVQTYDTEHDFDRVVRSGRQLLEPPKEAEEGDNDMNSMAAIVAGPAPKLRFLSSQYLVDSSLTQDLQFFGSLSGYAPVDSTVTQPDQLQQQELSAEEKPETSGDQSVGSSPSSSSRPILDCLLKLVDHVSSKFDPKTLEKIADYFQQKFRDHTHINVQLLLMRVLSKKHRVFEPFSDKFVDALVQLALKSDQYARKKEKTSSMFNSALREICYLLLAWARSTTKPARPSTSELATTFLDRLMKQAAHQKRAVLRDNLDLIHQFIGVWKPFLSIKVPSIVCGYLSAFKDDSSQAKVCKMSGLLLMSSFLSHGIAVYDPVRDSATQHPLTDQDLYRILIDQITFKTREVYRMAAEVLALCMRKREEQKQDDTSTLQKPLLAKMKGIMDEMDRFLTCLYSILKDKPDFVDPFLHRVAARTNQVYGEFRAMSLAILLERFKVWPPECDVAYAEVQAGLPHLLEHKDDAAQLTTILMVKELIKKMSAEEMLRALEISKAVFTNHTSEDCRLAYYQMLSDAYDNHAVLKRSAELGNLLMRGFLDESLRVHNFLYGRWAAAGALPPKVLPRLEEILRNMYFTESETQFLAYSTYLMLDLTKLSVDYTLLIHETPLSECSFKEIDFKQTALLKSNMSTPMFASSQDYSSQVMVVPNVAGEGIRAGLLRATQNTLEFTPTLSMSLGPGGGTLSLGQSQSARSLPLFRSTPIRTSQVVDNTIEQKTGLVEAALGELTQFQLSRASQASGGSPAPRTSVKNIDRERYRIAKMTEEKRRRDKVRQQRMKELRVVDIFRKYRDGELPDIQIRPQDIIGPLQELVKRDPTVARIFFKEMYQAVLTKPTPGDKVEEAEDHRQIIRSSVAGLLGRCGSYGPLIGTLQALCTDDPKAEIDPTVVANASSRADTYETGVLLLERLASGPSQNDQEEGGRPSKRKRQQGNSSQTVSMSLTLTVPMARSAADNPARRAAWSSLATVYQAINEDDIALGIHSFRSMLLPEIREAVKAELDGDFQTALDKYTSVQEAYDNGDISPEATERAVCEQGMLSCMRSLAQWEELSRDLIDDNIAELAAMDPKDDKFSIGLDAVVRLSVQKTPNEALFQYLDSCFMDSGKRPLFEENYACEMALVYGLRGELERARYFADLGYRSFLEHWTSLNPLSVAARHVALQGLPWLVQLDEYIRTLSELKPTTAKDSVPILLDTWQHRVPSVVHDPCPIWDTFACTAPVLASSLCQKALSMADIDKASLSSATERFRISVLRSAARGLIKQRNIPAAIRFLRSSLVNQQKLQGTQFMGQFLYAKSRYVQLKEDLVEGPMSKIASYNDQCHKLETVLRTVAGGASPEDRARSFILLGDMSLEVGHLRETITPSCGPEVFDAAYKHYDAAVSSTFGSIAVPTRIQGRALLRLADVCNILLTHLENKKGSSQAPLATYANTAMECVLRAMKLGAKHSLERLPWLLALLENYPPCRGTFEKECIAVPPWMFIMWIPHLMALLSHPIAQHIVPVVEALAQAYPQAIFYAFRSTNHGLLSNDTLSRINGAFAAHLKLQLVLEDFCFALDCLTPPVVRGRAWMHEMRGKTKAQVRKVWMEEVVPMLKHIAERQSCKYYNDLYSTEFKKYVALDRPERATDEQIGRFMQYLNSREASALDRYTGKANHIHFSPFFDNYENHYSTASAAFESAIEVPGQYDGRFVPQPELHVQIAGFEPSVVILSSKQKPKKLTMRGNDFREYSFLFKGGEDTRLDQRIELMFEIFNSILRSTAHSAKRRLGIATYKVIPISLRSGLFQWVNDTATMKDVVSEALSWKGRGHNYEADPAIMDYVSWSKGTDTRVPSSPMELSRDLVLDKLFKVWSMFPADLFRSALVAHAATPEAFLTLRSNYARSLATLSIAGYILGIGDRHVANLLFSETSGQLVPIDFGYSFDVGTIVLPIPELVPFRLTRQLIAVIAPLGIDVMLKPNMVSCLAALRARSELLLQTMDIFLKEPILDWGSYKDRIANAQGLAAGRGGADDGEDVDSWKSYVDGSKFVKISKDKLQGRNSSHITIEELGVVFGRSKDPAQKAKYKAAVSALKGRPKAEAVEQLRAPLDTEVSYVLAGSGRLDLPEFGLTPQQQVDCLVDQAMDPDLLGRMWAGWGPMV